MKSNSRTLLASFALSVTAIAPGCTNPKNAISTPTLTTPNIPMSQASALPPTTVIPHETSQLAQAISAHGDQVMDGDVEIGEIVLEGGRDDDCVATVIVDKVQTPNGKERILLSPGVATALQDMDATSMSLSVHLDVDTGLDISKPSIPAENITNHRIARQAANELLETAKIGCEIWARDIAPKQQN